MTFANHIWGVIPPYTEISECNIFWRASIGCVSTNNLKHVLGINFTCNQIWKLRRHAIHNKRSAGALRQLRPSTAAARNDNGLTAATPPPVWPLLGKGRCPHWSVCGCPLSSPMRATRLLYDLWMLDDSLMMAELWAVDWCNRTHANLVRNGLTYDDPYIHAFVYIHIHICIYAYIYIYI